MLMLRFQRVQVYTWIQFGPLCRFETGSAGSGRVGVTFAPRPPYRGSLGDLSRSLAAEYTAGGLSSYGMLRAKGDVGWVGFIREESLPRSYSKNY